MRPVRLELEGFTAFRERTEVDFNDADLFVLCGPTGSGKSSIIDAMSFALYGSVPRYQDPRLVHPVISQGQLETRVRFDFAVNGRTYTAVRVVRRTKNGATTREARLECGEQVLAASARELDQQVESLFGLSFDQFHTCVVLPQGEFAKFLHESPANRQDLLKELLGLREYERVGQMARQREAQIKNTVIVLEKRQNDFSGATPAARSAAKARLRDLKQLEKVIDAASTQMKAWEKEQSEHLTAVARHLDSAKRVAGLKEPRDVELLGREEVKTRADTKETERSRVEAEQKCAEAEAVCAKLPDPQPLRELRQAYLDRESEAKHLTAASEQGAALQRVLCEAQAAVKLAEGNESAARVRLENARRMHAACQLTADLSAGDPCPVCLRPIEEPPKHARPPALDRAGEMVKTAERARADASGAANEAGIRHAQATATLGDLRRRVDKFDQKLRGAPQRDEIDQRLKAIADSAALLAPARTALQRARQLEQTAREAHARILERIRDAWADFDLRRDALAAQGPPPADRGNLGASWKALVGWAQTTQAAAREKAAAAKKAADALAESLQAKMAEIAAACTERDVHPGKSAPRDAVIRAITQTEQDLNRIEADIAKRLEVESALKDAQRRQAVAHALGGHLNATGFERWLLQEAFERLVNGASERLKELSSGDYSFHLSDQLNFEIIDHRNADETRMVRTLSGGETFLASLALSLTLADQVSELAAEGTARLESIFLDEGFGSLDLEALDTVAATIEDLAARGRIVGIVTHVRDLADRIPVQYRVSRGPTSSQVERVVL